jgi:protein SCO1
MKNKSYIGTAFIILVFGIYAIPRIIDRIKANDIVKGDRLNIEGNKVASKSDLMTINKVPAFSFTNQNNQIISNNSYKGKVFVVEFFFSTCPSICPIMNKNMKDIQEAFAANSNFGIASITINPENDTPEVLKKHADLIQAKGINWHFLTGKKEDVMNLANKGFNLFAGENKKVNGGFEHSGLFALIDKNGNIRSRKDNFGNPIVYYDGLEQAGVKALKQDITKLLAE